MKEFLHFISELYKNLYENTFRKIASKKIPVALFAPSLSRAQKSDLISQLKRLEINLDSLFSTDPSEIQNPLQDIEIFEFVAPPPRKIEFVFLTQDVDSLIGAQRFIEWGIEPIIIDYNGSAHSQFNFYLEHVEDIFRIYKDVLDDASRKSLLGYILQRVSRRISFCKFAPESQYLLHGFLPKSGDIVIDGGACDGATAAMFSDLGCKVYSFEMDLNNFKMCQKTASEKNFVVENFGLADFPREVGYRSYGGGSNLYLDKPAPDSFPKAKITTLDWYVKEKNLPSVDFIKLDIEGSELAMLKGAADSIVRFKPRLAISAYHKPEDLWTLIDFIRSIRSDYEFAFRHFETTSDNAPFIFFGCHAHTDYLSKFCERFGLQMKYSAGHELVLFAR